MPQTLFKTRVGKNFIVKTSVVYNQVHSVLYQGIDSGIGDVEGFAVPSGEDVEAAHIRHCAKVKEKINSGRLLDIPLHEQRISQDPNIKAREQKIQQELDAATAKLVVLNTEP